MVYARAETKAMNINEILAYSSLLKTDKLELFDGNGISSILANSGARGTSLCVSTKPLPVLASDDCSSTKLLCSSF